MSDLQNFLNNGGDAALRRINDQVDSAGGLYPNATWYQIGVDKELTEFLRSSLDPQAQLGNSDERLLGRVIQRAELIRGSSIWRAAMNAPHSYATDKQSHRVFNLIERLYLTSPNGVGATAYFDLEWEPSVQRVQKAESIFIRAGVGLTLIGASIVWVISRRRSGSDLSNQSTIGPRIQNNGVQTPIDQIVSGNDSFVARSNGITETKPMDSHFSYIQPVEKASCPPRMTPIDSVRTCFGKYATFSGRASQAEFWWFFGFTLILLTLAGLLFPRFGILVASLLIGLPLNAVSARRLRDTGRNPWLVLLCFLHIPGGLVLAYLCAQPSLDVSAFTIENANDDVEQSIGTNDVPNRRSHAPPPIQGTRPVATYHDATSKYTSSNSEFVLSLLALTAIVIVLVIIQFIQNKVTLEKTSKKPELAIMSSSPAVEPIANLVNKHYSWSPSGALPPPQHVDFGSGREVVAFKPPGQLMGGVIRLRAGDGKRFIDTDVKDDFVNIEAVIHTGQKPLLAVVKSNCGGAMCNWSEYSVAYIHDNGLQIASIGSVLNSDFRIEVEAKGDEILSIRVTDMASGSRNEYGDLLKSNRTLVLGKGFVLEDFSKTYFSLIADQANAFFSHPTAREKLAQTIGLERFRELRSYASGHSSNSKIIDGKYLVFNACMTHSCDSKLVTVIFDGTTGNSWAIQVDAQSRKLWSGGSVPWNSELFNAAKPFIHVDAQPNFPSLTE